MSLNVLKLELCFSNCTIFEFHSFVVLFQLFKYKSFCYKSKVNTTSAFHNTTPQLKYHAILWGIQSLIRNTYTWLFWTWCLYGARKIPIRGTNTQGSIIFHKKEFPFNAYYLLLKHTHKIWRNCCHVRCMINIFTIFYTFYAVYIFNVEEVKNNSKFSDMKWYFYARLPNRKSYFIRTYYSTCLLMNSVLIFEMEVECANSFVPK